MPVLKLAMLGPEAVTSPNTGASIGALGLLLALEFAIDVDVDGLADALRGALRCVLLIGDAVSVFCACCAAAIALS